MDKFIIKKPRLDIESEGESRSINVATCSNDFSNPSTSQATTTSCSSFQGCLKTQVEVEGLVFAKNDIGHFVGVSNISDADKITLLRRVWEPLPSHKFCIEIIGSKKRTFQVKWLQRFPWLAYSDKLKGAFCKLCVVFCPSAVGSGYHESPENLVKKAFPKRAKILRDVLEERGKANSGLHRYCETRWVERHDAVIVLAECFECIISALEVVIENHKNDAAIEAASLHTSLCKFEFIITLTIMSKMLSVTLTTSKYLQKETLELGAALEKISLTEKTFSNMRTDDEFSKVFNMAQELANKLEVPVMVPRIVGTQRFRSNIESRTPEEFYRRTVYIPCIDEIMTSLKDRFLSHKDILRGLDNFVPANSVKKQYEDLRPALEFYKDDLRSSNNFILEAGYNLWKTHWQTFAADKLPKSALDTLRNMDWDMFPNIKILLTILAVIPVTTSSVERSFSTLKRLKNYLRNSTGEERLTMLTLLTVHRDIPVNIEDVINEFNSSTTRRLSLS
ncbi:52 kDa repressor of the inhibitor of the protein kinase-like [Diabrotica virgifera virgifera]|uniref:TTF-type domain-containing protein n=1 Tax=Diabrotica virgifera virgifera TaxID=50390 RepID=A0ABM5JZR6_DIAVI|nr:52 kDa repressor of the inhibitor of the protein kinase-like [Diabrotica virgifera virgifera]